MTPTEQRQIRDLSRRHREEESPTSYHKAPFTSRANHWQDTTAVCNQAMQVTLYLPVSNIFVV
jgi:hypothetical protein